MAGEKTEKATPKRKRDERKKGNVFQSREVVTVASLIVVFSAFKMLAPIILTTLQRCISKFVTVAGTAQGLTVQDIRLNLIDGAIVFALTALPLLLTNALVAIIASGAQTKFLFSAKSMAFKGSRLNPLSGIKRMFSMRSLIELLKSLLKITILGAIIYQVLSKAFPQFPRLMDMTVMTGMAFTGNVIYEIVKNAAGVFLFLAAADYGYQWWEYEKNLRMSKQDIKEEYKEAEGDPQVKGKIKERQQQQARMRMMQSVPSADVVIRNPTHYAVAIRYDSEKNHSPVVVAKGADHLALRIVAIAEEHGVVVLENRPLARGLYEAVDLEQEIPEQFFKPVAEVLAYVYNLKERTRK